MPTQPPEDLRAESQELWRDIVEVRRGAKTPQKQALLTEALWARDRAAEAAAEINATGLTFTTKTTGAVHIHPLVRVEKDARSMFSRIWGQLGLNIDPYGS